MMKKRIQLTLFINENESGSIEKIRKKFNPEQYQLIKSHATLCRENELESIDVIIQTLMNFNHPPIIINFGNIEKFSDGKGVFLSAIGDNKPFHELRNNILKNVIKNPENNEPHITLMHPRNSVCTNEIFEEIDKIKMPDQLEFRTICLIEQEEEKKWKILQEFELKIPDSFTWKK